jgi:hypothetical protein
MTGSGRTREPSVGMRKSAIRSIRSVEESCEVCAIVQERMRKEKGTLRMALRRWLGKPRWLADGWELPNQE